MKERLKKFLPGLPTTLALLGLAAITIALFWKLIFGSGIVAYGDNPYTWRHSFRAEYSSVWDQNALGSISPVLSLDLFFVDLVPRALGAVGLPDALVSKIWIIGLVYLFGFVVYACMRVISKSALYGFTAAALILLSHFIVDQYIYWGGPYFLNAIGLVLVYTLLYFAHEQGFTRLRAACIVLVSFIIWQPFYIVLCLALVALFLLYQFVIGLRDREHVILGIATLCGIVCVHFHWLLPFLSLLFSHAVETYNGNLELIFAEFREIATPANSLLWFQYPRLLAKALYTSTWEFHAQYVLVALGGLASLASFFYRESTRRSRLWVGFSLLLYVVFLLVALGPNGYGTGKVFTWIFTHVPAAGFFRSFTRFLILALIGYLGALAVAVRSSRFRGKHIVIALFATVLLFTHRGFAMGNLGGILPLARVPESYYKLNEEYFEDGPPTYNIAMYPNTGYEATTWDINSNTYAFTEHTYFRTSFFGKPVISNSFAGGLDRTKPNFAAALAYDDNFSPYSSLADDLRLLNVRYVLVSKDTVNFLDPINISRNLVPWVVDVRKYRDYFGQSTAYQLREDTPEFTLYEVRNFAPKVDGYGQAKLTFEYNHPTEYAVTVENMKQPFTLVLRESFHPGWILNVGGDRIVGKQIGDYAIGWTLDPKTYGETVAGSIYFAGQRLFLWGSLVTLLGMTICLWEVSKRTKKTNVSATT